MKEERRSEDEFERGGNTNPCRSFQKAADFRHPQESKDPQDLMNKENISTPRNKLKIQIDSQSRPKIMTTNICSFDVKREKVWTNKQLLNGKTNRFLSAAVNGYRRIRFFVNITCILVSSVAVISVMACLLAGRHVQINGCQIESIDLKLHTGVDLTIKAKLNTNYTKSIRFSDIKISLSHRKGYSCFTRLITEQICIPDGETVTINLSGPLNNSKPLLTVFEELSFGVEMKVSGKIHVNKFLGFSSSLPFERTVDVNPSKESNDSGLILRLFKGEFVNFYERYLNEERASLIDFTVNKNVQEYSNALNIPIVFPNLKIFSLCIKDLEILYFGDNLKTETFSITDFKIQKGIIQPNNKISSSLKEPILSIDKTLMNIYSSNKHITLQDIRISGHQLLSKYMKLKDDGKYQNKLVDYEFDIKEVSIDSVKLTINILQTDNPKPFFDFDFSSKQYALKTLDDTPEFITHIGFLVNRKKTGNQSINIHLIDINWHVLLKSMKNFAIVKLFDFKDTFCGYFSFQLMDLNYSLENLHEKCQEPREGNFVALKSVIKTEQQNFVVLENNLNLKIPQKGVNYKRRFRFNFPKTEIRLFNELFDLSISIKEQILNKACNSERLVEEFEFDCKISPKVCSIVESAGQYTLDDIFRFKIDDKTGVDFLNLSMGFVKGSKIAGLSNNLKINVTENLNFDIFVEKDLLNEEDQANDSSGFNWNIVLSPNYRISNIKDNIEIKGLKSIDVTFKENRMDFNNLRFNLKLNDNFIIRNFTMQDLVFNISDVNTTVEKIFSIFVNCVIVEHLGKKSDDSVKNEFYNLEYYKNNNMKSLDVFNKKSLEIMRQTEEKINQLPIKSSKADFGINFDEKSKKMYFNFKYERNTKFNNVFDFLKRKILELNSHKFFKEIRTDVNVLQFENIWNLNELFLNYSNLPFNNIILNVTTIELNIHEETNTKNVLRLSSSCNIFNRNQEELDLQLVIDIQVLLKFLGSENISYSIVARNNDKDKFNVYSGNGTNSLFVIMKSILSHKSILEGKTPNDKQKKTFSISHTRSPNSVYYIALGECGLKGESLYRLIDYLLLLCPEPTNKISLKLQQCLFNINIFPDNKNPSDIVRLEMIEGNMESLCSMILKELFVLFGGFVELPPPTGFKRILDSVSESAPIRTLVMTIGEVFLYGNSGDITHAILSCFSLDKCCYKDRIDINFNKETSIMRVSIILDTEQSQNSIELNLWEFHFNGQMIKLDINYDKETFSIKKLIFLIGKDNNLQGGNTKVNGNSVYFQCLLEALILFLNTFWA